MKNNPGYLRFELARWKLKIFNRWFAFWHGTTYGTSDSDILERMQWLSIVILGIRCSFIYVTPGGPALGEFANRLSSVPQDPATVQQRYRDNGKTGRH